jgi:hypothetical protein
MLEIPIAAVVKAGTRPKVYGTEWVTTIVFTA